MPVILFKYVNIVTVGPNAYKLFSYKKRVCCLLKKYIQFLNLKDLNAFICQRIFQIIFFFLNNEKHIKRITIIIFYERNPLNI